LQGIPEGLVRDRHIFHGSALKHHFGSDKTPATVEYRTLFRIHNFQLETVLLWVGLWNKF
jgi:hypothetical protein